MENKWVQGIHYTELMLTRRGYAKFREIPTENNTTAFVFTHLTRDTLLVWFFCHDKMNIDSIKEFIHLLEEHEIKHGLIVYQNTVTTSTRKVMENLFQFKMELFELKELQYDLTEFRYYCPHELLEPAKMSEVRKKFGTSLPTLLRTDPVVRYYHFQKGDIIRITRKNNTQIYRMVK